MEQKRLKKYLKKINTVCKRCKKEFRYYEQAGKTRKYCSKECFLLSIETKKITKEVLIERLRNESWSAIGRDCGVSDNAVRKWAKGYGLI